MHVAQLNAPRPLAAAPGFGPDTALLVIDAQRDFVDASRGTLPVPGAAALLPRLNQLAAAAAGAGAPVVASADWHPPDHVSFHTTHPGGRPGQVLQVSAGGRQVEVRLFPPHCVAGSPGAQFAEGLDVAHISHTVLKGTKPALESMSAFHDITAAHTTGLAEWLRGRRVRALFVCGVATEHCVRASVLDGLQAGFQVALLTDAVAGVDAAASQAALREMECAGAALMHSGELLPPLAGRAGIAAGPEQQAGASQPHVAGRPCQAAQANVCPAARTAAAPARNGQLACSAEQQQALARGAGSAMPASQPAVDAGEE